MERIKLRTRILSGLTDSLFALGAVSLAAMSAPSGNTISVFAETLSASGFGYTAYRNFRYGYGFGGQFNGYGTALLFTAAGIASAFSDLGESVAVQKAYAVIGSTSLAYLLGKLAITLHSIKNEPKSIVRPRFHSNGTNGYT